MFQLGKIPLLTCKLVASCVFFWRRGVLLCSVCLLHFLPALSSAGKQISKSPGVAQQDTRSACSDALYQRLLCNVALQHLLLVFGLVSLG